MKHSFRLVETVQTPLTRRPTSITAIIGPRKSGGGGGATLSQVVVGKEILQGVRVLRE